MRLRSRMEEMIRTVCVAHLPEALSTVWDAIGVTVFVESLKFTPGSGEDGQWFDVARFEGVARVELRAGDADELVIEPLISALVDNTPTLKPLAVEPNALTECARLTLIEQRDRLTDREAVTGLRFDVSGFILRRLPDAPPPLAMIGRAPEIGPDHLDDYKPLNEWTGIE